MWFASHRAGAYLEILRTDFGVDLPRMPTNKSETFELRVRKQVCVWKHIVRKLQLLAGQLSAPGWNAETAG